MRRLLSSFVVAWAGLSLWPGTGYGTIVTDDFEVDSSASYTVVDDGTPDNTIAFAFDYLTAGVPLAPRSAAGDRHGLFMTVNDTAGAVDTLTAFHNTNVNVPKYKMTVDVYMAFGSASTGTTEFGHVGVGGDGATPNSLFTPISGSGSFMAFTGDGGSGSDYRWFLDGANGGPTTYPNTDPSYLDHGSNNSGAFYQALFPSPPSTIAGSPGNIWTTVEVSVDNVNKQIQYRMDGQLIFDSTPNGPFTGDLLGLVSVGLHDAFTSVATPNGSVFTVFDNLEVVQVPEPTSWALMSLMSLAALGVRRRR